MGTRMKPTNKLRWFRRKGKIDPYYVNSNGLPYQPYYTILQQWWQESSQEIYTENAVGEWRDVDMEEE